MKSALFVAIFAAFLATAFATGSSKVWRKFEKKYYGWLWYDIILAATQCVLPVSEIRHFPFAGITLKLSSFEQ